MFMTTAQARILMVSIIEENRALATITGRIIKHKIAAGSQDSTIDHELYAAAELLAEAQLGLTALIEDLQRRVR